MMIGHWTGVGVCVRVIDRKIVATRKAETTSQREYIIYSHDVDAVDQKGDPSAILAASTNDDTILVARDNESRT